MRKIIHIDADCFYAAVEMRDNPALRNIPIAIGGPAQSRGVLATANYPARTFGVKSAMPSSQAKRLCPDLLILSGNMEKYREASKRMHDIFRDYTNIIEPLSLDEAYLDVTDSKSCNGSATLIAEEIRKRIESSIGITVSAGVSVNKFLAKVASDWDKPNGLTTIGPHHLQAFVDEIPVGRISGVGKVAQEKLTLMGVETCADLRKISFEDLSKSFGSMAYRLMQFSNGIDDRPVRTSRERKSLSVEHTFANDLPSLTDCMAQLPSLLEELGHRMRNKALDRRIKKYYLKLKFNDFSQTTVESPLSGALNLTVFEQLLATAFRRYNRPVRLLGVGYRLASHNSQQLELFS